MQKNEYSTNLGHSKSDRIQYPLFSYILFFLRCSLDVHLIFIYIALSPILFLIPYIPRAVSFSPLHMSDFNDSNGMIKESNFDDIA